MAKLIYKIDSLRSSQRLVDITPDLANKRAKSRAGSAYQRVHNPTSFVNSCSINLQLDQRAYGHRTTVASIALSQTGWIIGLTMLITFAFLTRYTAALLQKCLDYNNSVTYSDMGFTAFGKSGMNHLSKRA